MKHCTDRHPTALTNAVFPRPAAAAPAGLPCVLKLILLPLLIAAMAACAPITPAAPAEPQSLRPITLGVGFIPNVQFAPFYVGIEKGFFAERGVELSLDYGFENDYLKLVATDEMQFMIASGDQLVLGRAQELPVKYVHNWYTSYPVTVFAKAGAGIHEPADLAGRKVGVPGPFGATYIALRALLDVAGLTEADIQMESIGFTQASAVSQDLVDAAVDYAVNGPVVLGNAGIETVQIPLDQYLQIPANGLVTNERTLQEEPQLVEAMVRALQKSVAYTLRQSGRVLRNLVDLCAGGGWRERGRQPPGLRCVAAFLAAAAAGRAPAPPQMPNGRRWPSSCCASALSNGSSNPKKCTPTNSFSDTHRGRPFTTGRGQLYP